MNKKGFTLVELLVVFVIIALIGGIGLVSYKTFLDNGESNYYKSLENNIILAANDYYLDNRDMLPVIESENEVELSELVEKKYLENIKGSNGQTCSGTAVVYKENGKYVYEACLNCDGYHSKGKYCPDSNGGNSGTNMQKSITITGRTQSGGTYNPNLNYENVSQVSEKVTIIFSMNNVTVDKYEIINTGTSKKEICEPSEGNTCEWPVDKSGTYSVTAYDDKGKVLISNQRFNVRIVKKELGFSVIGLNHKLSQTECSGDKKATINFTIKKNADRINEEYKKIEYGLKRYKYDGTEETIINNKTIHSMSDSFRLGSGHYELILKITNFANDETIGTFPFNVSYDVEIEYDDDHSKAKHEVVKDYPYNYLKPLPTVKDAYGVEGLDIKWTRNGEKIDGTTIVTDDCPYKIIGEMAIPVPVPDLDSYCIKNVVYNGSSQPLTKEPPANVQFEPSTGIEAKSHPIKAKINAPLYIWSDGTFTEKTFFCPIKKADGILSCANRIYSGSPQDMYSKATGCKSVINGSQTTVGSWTLTCVPDDNYNAPSTCIATMSAQKCNAPTNIAISTAGKVTWTNSSNCSGAQHQISIDGTNFTNASSGVDYKSTIIGTTGKRTVYVRAVAPNDNYITSDGGSKSINVYTVSLSTGQGIKSVSGAGVYIEGSTVSIDAILNDTHQIWSNWTGTETLTTKNTSITVNSDYSLTANAINLCASTRGSTSCSYGGCNASCSNTSGTKYGTCTTYYYSTVSGYTNHYCSSSSYPSSAGCSISCSCEYNKYIYTGGCNASDCNAVCVAWAGYRMGYCGWQYCHCCNY